MEQRRRLWSAGMMLVATAALAVTAAFSVFAGTAQAAQSVPYLINFQGRLTDNSGNTLTDGSYNIRFRIYDAATGGTLRWSGNRTYVATDNRIGITNGLFNLQFGDTTKGDDALSPILFNNQTYANLYLEVELPTPATATCSSNGCASFTEGPMTPRQPLASSPYAFNSDTLDGLDATAFGQLTASNTFTGTNLFAPTTASTVALTVKATTAGSTNALEVFSSSGTRQAYFDAAGALNVSQTIQPTSNNAVDLGTSSLAVRSGYFGTSVVTPALNVATSGGTLTTNAGTVSRTAAGTTVVDLVDTATTVLQVKNSSSGVANLNLFGGSLTTGSSGTVRLTNGGALSNITGFSQTAGSFAISQASSVQARITANAVKTADMFQISNSGQVITADGVSAQQIDYFAALAAAASQASALRVNLTNTSAVAGATTNGIRVFATANVASNTNGIKVDDITSGAGTDSALNIGTGWDFILNSANATLDSSGNLGLGSGGTIKFGGTTVCTSAGCTPSGGGSAGSIVQAPTSTAANTIAPTAASVVALTVKGTTGTAANVFEIFNSAASPTRQAYFDTNGALNVAQTIQPTANNAVNIGTTSLAFANVYAANFDTGTTSTALAIGTTNAASVTIGKAAIATNLASGVITNGNQQIINFSRTLPATVNDTVDIGTTTLGNGVGSFNIRTEVASGCFAVTKSYDFVATYNATNGAWFTVQPNNDSGNFCGNDYGLEVSNANAGSMTMRLRRTGGTDAGTINVTMTRYSQAGDSFTASTATTSAPAAATGALGNSNITQKGTNFGVLTQNPNYPLDVNGDINSSGALRSSKFLLGADLSLVPISGNQSAVTSWWGLQLVGNKQGSPDYTPTAVGAADVASVIIPNQQAGSAGLLISGASGQTGDLLRLTNNGLTPVARFDSNGNLTSPTINATTGYQANGTAGVTQTCSAGQALTGSIYNMGILTTAGTCTTTGSSGALAQVPTTTAQNTIAPTTASVVALTVKGTTGTSANVLEIFNSAATPSRQAFFSSTGGLNVAQTIQPTANNSVSLGTTTLAIANLYAANLDTGTVTTALTVGTSNAASITIGKSGVAVSAPGGITTSNGAINTGSGAITSTGTITAATFSGPGASLTNLNPTNLTTGSGAVTLQPAASTALNLTTTGTGAINVTPGTGGIVNNIASGVAVNYTTTSTQTVDLMTIQNTSALSSTLDGINLVQQTFYGKPASGNMQSSERINVNNVNTATGGQIQGLRIAASGAGGSIASDTAGIVIDALTNASSGTGNENAIEIGSGWDAGFYIQSGGNDIVATSTQALTVANASSLFAFTVDTSGNKVQIGSATSDANQILLQVDTYQASTTSVADTASCATTTNQGSLYYNSTTNAIRGCIGGAWEDVVSTAGLGIIAYGVIGDTGSNPGDIASLTTAGVTGPCKVSWTSTTSVTVAPCAVFSSGRKMVVPSAVTLSLTTFSTTNIYAYVCLNPTTGAPYITTPGASETTSGLPTFSISAPVLCLAQIRASTTTANAIAQIFDIRTFTNTLKTWATITTTIPSLGQAVVANGTTTTAVSQSGTGGSASIVGVVVASSGSSSTTAPNGIIATMGPQYIKATSGTAGQFATSSTVTTGTGAGAVMSASAIATTTIGPLKTTSTAATTCSSASTCLPSVLVDMRTK